MSVLPKPLTSAVIASQIAITASPISAATAAMYVVVEKWVFLSAKLFAVIVPAAIAGSIVAVIISSYQGVDPEKKIRSSSSVLRKGLVVLKSKQKDEQPTTAKAKLSVGIFLLAVLFIVGMLLFKTQIGHTLGSRDIIIIAMLMSGLVTYWVCKFPLSGIKDTPVFGGGMESLIVVLGIVWMSSTIIGAHIPEIKTSATHLLEQYPCFACRRILLCFCFVIQSGRNLSPSGSRSSQFGCRCRNHSRQLRCLLCPVHYNGVSDNSFCDRL